MKLVLLQPPIQDFYDTSIRLQPIGLAYLKAAVKRYLPKWEVVIKDFHRGWGRRTMVLPKELAYLKDYYPWPDRSPFSLFYHYFHFGASFETIAREVAQEQPDLVGISSLFSPYYREVLQCAQAIKENCNCRIVIGGSHVSTAPELMLTYWAVDWVIRGEGERALVELIKVWEKGSGFEQVPGLGYKDHGRLVFNPIGDPYPMDQIPSPDYSDLDHGSYCYEKRPMCLILSSRGCPYRCSFCSVHQTFPRYRRRTVGNIVEEMVRRYEEGYRVFDFEDDNLTYDQEEMKSLCRTLSRTFPAGEIECLAMNGLSYQSLDGELLLLMKEAGFTRLNLSLVTSNPALLKSSGRPDGLDSYLEAVDRAFQLGFRIVSYQILGLPGESLDSMIQTLRFNARLPVLIGPSPFYLTPRTPLAENFPKSSQGDLLRSRLTALAIETDQFERGDIYTLFITARIVNFFKGLRLEHDPIPLPEALSIARHQGKRSALGAGLFERLITESRLYAMTKEGIKDLTRFKPEVFFNFWSELGEITTQEGKKIEILY
jgi:radical SAM superfamily enzyme YgiQ (UPF0313 family)